MKFGNAQPRSRCHSGPRHLSTGSRCRLGCRAREVPTKGRAGKDQPNPRPVRRLGAIGRKRTENTLRGYVSALRKIVSDSFGLDPGKEKVAYGGGHQKWVERVDSVRLASLTPQRVQQWKRSFLADALPDPISQRAAKTSVNTPSCFRPGVCFPKR